MPYAPGVHTVIETPAYIAQAKAEGMTQAERDAAVNLVAGDPQAGDAIVGSGGYRKVRLAGRGKGKSGGYRLVSFFAGTKVPVFLVAVLSKSSRANFSDAEIRTLAKMAKTLAASLGSQDVD